MYRLAIDASDKIMTLSLRKTDQGEIEHVQQELDHVEGFPRLLKHFLLKHGLKPEQLGSLSLIQGPGAYTGLRGSLLVAASLAHYAKVPVMLRQRQEVMLYACRHQGTEVMSVQNVRQHQYHVAVGLYHDGEVHYSHAPAVLTEAELLQLQQELNCPVVGDWPAEVDTPSVRIQKPDLASVLAEWSEKKFVPTPMDSLTPYYTRPAVNPPAAHAKAEQN